MSKKLEGLKYNGLNLYSPLVPDSYVAYTYNKNLTVLENLYALWNEVGKIDKMFWDIKEIINAMVEFLNGEGLQSHVTEKLTEWLDDGTLEELINVTLFNSKADKVYVEDELKKLNDTLEDELKKNKNYTDEKVSGVDLKLSELVDKTIKESLGNVNLKLEEVIIKNQNGIDNTAYIVEIPYKNDDGTKNIIKKGFANGGWNRGYSTAQDFDDMIKPTLTINAGFLNYEAMYTKNIYNGEVKSNSAKLQNVVNLLGWNDEGVLSVHNTNENMYDLLDEGITNIIQAWSPIVIDGRLTPELWNETPSQPSVQTIPNPRTVIGQLENKNYVILVCTGREYQYKQKNQGLGNNEIGQYMLNKYGPRLKILYNADGGGSSQMIVNGKSFLPPIDNNKQSFRENGEFIYFKREGNDLSKQLNTTRDTIRNISGSIELFGLNLKNIETLEYATNAGYSSLNDIHKSSAYWIDRSVANKPNGVGDYGILLMFNMIYGHGVQIYVPVAQTKEEYAVLAIRMKRYDNKTNTHTFDRWFYWKGLPTL